MEIKIMSGDVAGIKAGAIVVGLIEGTKHPEGDTAAVDRALDGAISQLINEGEIKGKLNENTLIHTLGKLPASRVVVIGLGKQNVLSLDRVRGAAAEACRFLRRKGVDKIATVALGSGLSGINHESAAQAIAEGAILGLYTFRKHKTSNSEDSSVNELIILAPDATTVPVMEQGCRKGIILAEATNLARDMANEPANYMTPADMADKAREMADKYSLELEIIEREQMQELGMGALLGVAQGSRQPPKFIIIRYQGSDSKDIDIALVGKAVTFDSGGISIKTSAGMGAMKGDMAGGAAVIAAMGAIAQLKPSINVLALIPATENLPDGSAIKPGDVLTAMDGKTIEIITTDAEGRLILADALGYAKKQEVKRIIDVATLTGAISIALGDICIGAFSNNQQLVEQVITAGAEAGEKIWQLPTYDEYKEQNKSDVADIKNSGGRAAGSITGALFVGEFAGDTPWVHLDIAGMDIVDKEKTYLVKGATGIPVRTLAKLVVTLAEK